VSGVVVQEVVFWVGKSPIMAGWPGRLRNVRLAALDLEGSQEVDLGGLGRNHRFRESRVFFSLKFTYFSLFT